MSIRDPQSAAAVFMVRPARFGFNAETAASNTFQQQAPSADAATLQEMALGEFDSVVQALRAALVEVFVGEDTPEPHKPDAIFPNNWLSLHADGSVVLYPMCAPNRRPERREELIAGLLRDGGFQTSRTVDLSHREAQQQFLEGTGSLVLDRAERIAYACLSTRTALDILGEFAQRLDYEVVAFDAADGGCPIYHTNVLMAVGERFAVVCAEVITDPRRRADVLSRLDCTGHELIAISRAQMRAFAGNCLELATLRGKLIVVSETAWQALDPGQRAALERHGAILRVQIPTIERAGGGSVRCMLAEVHLPRRR